MRRLRQYRLLFARVGAGAADENLDCVDYGDADTDENYTILATMMVMVMVMKHAGRHHSRSRTM